MTEDLAWGEDFDEAEVEESFFKASQIYPINVGRSSRPGPSRPSKSYQSPSSILLDDERRAIQDLLDDPAFLDDNVFDDCDDGTSDSTPHDIPLPPIQQSNCERYIKKNTIANLGVVDTFESLDPDLCSQPIPGTQPHGSVNKYPLKTSVPVGTARINSPTKSVLRKTSENFFIKQGNVLQHGQSTGLQSKITSVSTNATVNHHDNCTLRSESDTTKLKSSSNVSTEIGRGNSNETELLGKLKEVQKIKMELERELMTKTGEVSCLRSELQRKSVALDTERMSRLAAIDEHKKDVTEKIAAAAKDAQSKSCALEKRIENMQSDLAFKNREITELVNKCKKLEQLNALQERQYQQQLREPTPHEYQCQPQKNMTAGLKTSASWKPAAGAGSRSISVGSGRFPVERFDFSDKAPKGSIVDKQQQQQLDNSSIIEMNSHEELNNLKEALKSFVRESYTACQNVRGMSVSGVSNTSMEVSSLLASLSRNESLTVKQREDAASVNLFCSPVNSAIEAALNCRHRYTRDPSMIQASCEPISLPGSMPGTPCGNVSKDGWKSLSVIAPREQANHDFLLPSDEEANYSSSYDTNDSPDLLNRILSANSQTALYKAIQYERISERRVGAFNSFEATTQLKASLLAGGDGEMRYSWAEGCAWSDDDVNNRSKRITTSVTSVSRHLNAKADTDDKVELSGETTALLEILPHEWLSLICFIAMENQDYNSELISGSDRLSDEEVDESEMCNSEFCCQQGSACGESMATDGGQGAAGTNKKLDEDTGIHFRLKQDDLEYEKLRRLALAPKIGSFLYNFLEERKTLQGEDNPANKERPDCGSAEQNGDGKPTRKRKMLRKKENNDTNFDCFCCSDGECDDAVKRNINLYCSEKNRNSHIYKQSLSNSAGSSRLKLKPVSSLHYKRCTATKNLFISILRWLAEEATYYNDLEKKAVIPRSTEDQCQSRQILTTALVILQHLLRLYSHCPAHLPQPMVVLAHLLQPRHVPSCVAFGLHASNSRCSSHVVNLHILHCLSACSEYSRNASLSLEVAQLLMQRLREVCSDCTDWGYTDALLQCVAHLFTHHAAFRSQFCSTEGDEQCLLFLLCVLLIKQTRNLSCSTSACEENMATPLELTISKAEEKGLRSFLRLLHAFLLTNPEWLHRSNCDCAFLAVVVLLGLMHAEVKRLLRVLPVITEVRARCLCFHRFSNTKTDGKKLNPPLSSCFVKSSEMKQSQIPTSSKIPSTDNKVPHNISQGSLVEAAKQLCYAMETLNDVNMKSTATLLNCLNSTTAKKRSENSKTLLLGGEQGAQLSCLLCGAPSNCKEFCACQTRLCVTYADERLLDVQRILGFRCGLLWAGLRTLRLSRSSESDSLHMVPHYTLLQKLLRELLPLLPQLSDSETVNIVQHLP